MRQYKDERYLIPKGACPFCGVLRPFMLHVPHCGLRVIDRDIIGAQVRQDVFDLTTKYTPYYNPYCVWDPGKEWHHGRVVGRFSTRNQQFNYSKIWKPQ